MSITLFQSYIRYNYSNIFQIELILNDLRVNFNKFSYMYFVKYKTCLKPASL